jgi:hypothetical protein
MFLGYGGGQTSVPKQKRPNRFRVASRPMSIKERGNLLEDKTDVGKAGRSSPTSAEFIKSMWIMYETAVVLPV